jgi:hypothetical protein
MKVVVVLGPTKKSRLTVPASVYVVQPSLPTPTAEMTVVPLMICVKVGFTADTAKSVWAGTAAMSLVSLVKGFVNGGLPTYRESGPGAGG